MPGGFVTVKDVAREADVSVGTVSRVFNNHANVAEDIRRRVLKTAAHLGYAGSARYQAQGLSGNGMVADLGFLFVPVNEGTSAVSSPFWSHILGGVEAEALKSQIRLSYRSLSGLRDDPGGALEAVRRMRLDGMLVVGTAAPTVVSALRSLGLPLVLVESYAPGQGVDAVISDSFEGARAAVAYLIDAGHRDIGFINGPLHDAPRPQCRLYTVEMRARGYRAALIEADLPVRADLQEACDLTSLGGYEACRRLLARSTPFTALFCANDSTAIGAMRALHEAGLSVPGDVSVIGYGDDTDISEHLTPALTTVRIDKEVVGATAVKRLLARAADPDAAPVLTVLEVALIIRGSVVPPALERHTAP